MFGQELNGLTSSIARMNLYLNGVEDFSIVCADTLTTPAFLDGSHLRKFDIVLANPPYSIKTWNQTAFANDKWGRNYLGTPPQGCADYAFIQHIFCSMDDAHGRCAILLPHGILGRIDEQSIRENLVASDIIECVIGIGKNLFFNSPMEACVLICRKNKPLEKRHKVQFINAKHLVTRKNSESYLEPEHIKEIVDAYNRYDNIEGLSAVVDQKVLEDNKCMLKMGLYVRRTTGADYLDFNAEYQDWKAKLDVIHESNNNLFNLLGIDK